MKSIIWTKKFSVGIDSIDTQHKKLFEMVNQLNLHGNKNAKKESINDILNDLVDYAKEHFNTEEELLDFNGYEYIVEHIQYHTDFIKKLNTFYNQLIKKNNQNIIDDILDYLSYWIEDHILIHDLKYAELLVKK